MKNLAITSYSLTASVYLLLVLWLVFQGKVKETSQQYFVGWLFIFSILGITGTLLTATDHACDAFIIFRTHLALVVASGVALFLFATSLCRELKERDLLYILPALAMMSLIWTVLTKGVKETSYGWEPIFNEYLFYGFIVVLYGYYIAAIYQLYRVLSVLRESRSKIALRRVRILLYSVIFLTLAGCLTPIGRAFDLHFMPALLNALYIFPAVLMAYSFRLTE